VARLEPLREVRAPFAACQRQILSSVLSRHLSASAAVIEIGAGLGQLSEWLPQPRSASWVHTDPDAGALAAHRQRFPDAAVEQCSVETLPFESRSRSAAIGLCVLDLVTDLERSLAEIRRILAPGGLLIHIVDMAPALEPLFAALAVRDFLAVPNVFSDPSVSRFPEDLLVSARAPFEALLSRLDAIDHPLVRVFGHYFRAFAARPFDASAVARGYDAIARTEDIRALLAPMLLSAYAAGHGFGLPPPRGTLVSSGRDLSQRLARAAERSGFGVLENDVLSAWSHAPKRDGEPAYRSLCLGHERRTASPPPELLCESAPLAADGHALIEAGMHVFVARAKM
jgi:SAM-dependent methyltransferase